MAKDFTGKTFQKILRGYAPEEVDEYIAYMDEEYRKLERKNEDNERKLTMALRKLDQMHRQQEEIQKKADEERMKAVREAQILLEEAQASAEQTKKSASAKAEQYLQEASAAAKSMQDSAKAQKEEAEREAACLHDTVESLYAELLSFRDGLFASYSSHIENIEGIIQNGTSLTEKAEKVCADIDLAAYTESSHTKTEPVPKATAYEPVEEAEDVPADTYDATASRQEPYITSPVNEEIDFSGDFDFDLRPTENADLALQQDFGEGPAEGFLEMDSLFSVPEDGEELSLTDEFNIVFSGADSKRNVEEIRRQTIVPAEAPFKPKKHRRF